MIWRYMNKEQHTVFHVGMLTGLDLPLLDQLCISPVITTDIKH